MPHYRIRLSPWVSNPRCSNPSGCRLAATSNTRFFKPLAVFGTTDRTQRKYEILQIRLTANQIGELTAEDFGARPESFNAPAELLWSVLVTIDVSKALWQ